jgi:uncharacterized protein YggU (UPF0235/DUF167 family)
MGLCHYFGTLFEELSMFTHITVRLTPNARENILEPFEEFPIHIRLTASPRENQANGALVKVLSKKLSIPQRCFTIVQGRSCRLKRIRVDGIGGEELLEKLRLCGG